MQVPFLQVPDAPLPPLAIPLAGSHAGGEPVELQQREDSRSGRGVPEVEERR